MRPEVRIVRCPCCAWLTVLPGSIDPEAALELGRGLALLHRDNAHHSRALDARDFQFENFDSPHG